MSRRLAREAAMCLLYEREIQGMKTDGTLKEMQDVLHTEKIEEKHGEYIKSVLEAFDENRQETDSIIDRFSRSWNLDRISKVDLSILRLAIIEMLVLKDIPYKVSVNEAVELAKKYSDQKAPAYINGMLGSVIECYGVQTDK